VCALRAGGVVAYPTEAVFGLGCDARDPRAVRRLLALKGRDRARGLIVIASAPRHLRRLVRTRGAAWERAAAAWPGFVTWLLPVLPGTPVWLTGRHRRLAVRFSAHPVARALCRAFGGPIVSTSANRTGRAPARSARAVRIALGSGVAAVVAAPVGGEPRPSPIRDAVTGCWVRV
jgi:L-threonylcarbamoyladenylate synthase